MSAIEVIDLVAGHNGVPAVRGLQLHVDDGEVVALLGPNGAGKSTILWTIAGVLPPLGGSVKLFGRPTRGMSTHAVARLGLALVPEDRGLFFQLSVAENLRLHGHRQSRVTPEHVFEYFPALARLVNRKVGLLSGGEQQMLAVGCALVAQPRALMIDEMSLGLAPIIVERLLPIVRTIATNTNMAVLIVEQHVQAALAVADRGYVMSHGELVAEGAASTLAQSQELLEASYLGAAKLG
jgi:branched-chain amino acid transport system ATP-binding protein